MIALWLLAGSLASPPADIRLSPARGEAAITLSPAEMFDAADAAQRNSDPATAEAIYRALTANRDVEIRNEARFRLARMFEAKDRLSDAAALLKAILEEQPETNPVRLELAKVLAAMGDAAGARRELGAARSGGLPREVARQVDRFSDALRASKPMGGSIEIAAVSDSNVNRATRSDTLGTVIGDFTLDKDARAQSGHGIALEGQGYGRIALSRSANLLGSISGVANLYGKSRFNDVALGASAGPELTVGNIQLHPNAGFSRRWYGHSPFTDAATVQLDAAHPVAATAQVRGAIAGSRIWNHLNPLETGYSYSGTVTLEGALTETTGGGVTVTGIRQDVRDAGYSTKAGQLSLFGWHEAGRMTFTSSLTYGRLKADERLILYPVRRDETLTRATVAASARQLEFKGFAPSIAFTWERNRSPIEIYDYGRTVLDVGLTRAF